MAKGSPQHPRRHVTYSPPDLTWRDVTEEEVERICQWPRTHQQPFVRKNCEKLVEERSEEIVVAISTWARDGSYGLHLSEGLSDALRPALCGDELGVCTSDELDELVTVDADETKKLNEANETGLVKERPIESERPSNQKEGILVRVVGSDFGPRR